MTMLRALVFASVAATPSYAEPAVGDCEGWQANARNVDWSQPSPTFANGDIRLVALDTEEPAAAAFHLIVLFPDADDLFKRCQMVSAGLEGVGFAGLDLSRADAAYDPATGLTVTVPVSGLTGDGDFAERPLAVTINQATGQVIARD